MVIIVIRSKETERRSLGQSGGEFITLRPSAREGVKEEIPRPLFLFSLLLKPHWDMPLSASLWGRKKDRCKRHMGIYQQKENHVLTLFQIDVLEFLILLFHLLLPLPKL